MGELGQRERKGEERMGEEKNGGKKGRKKAFSKLNWSTNKGIM